MLICAVRLSITPTLPLALVPTSGCEAPVSDIDLPKMPYDRHAARGADETPSGITP